VAQPPPAVKGAPRLQMWRGFPFDFAQGRLQPADPSLVTHRVTTPPAFAKRYGAASPRRGEGQMRAAARDMTRFGRFAMPWPTNLRPNRGIARNSRRLAPIPVGAPFRVRFPTPDV
jgi:hypothetical protein